MNKKTKDTLCKYIKCNKIKETEKILQKYNMEKNQFINILKEISKAFSLLEDIKIVVKGIYLNRYPIFHSSVTPILEVNLKLLKKLASINENIIDNLFNKHQKLIIQLFKIKSFKKSTYFLLKEIEAKNHKLF